ncbi:MAG: hypothetical protein COB49_01100 [Alphaproteobacteria bacterium]|nr:MAG: hypothetical protein COB49_01100 [Alphaproteobacteria bacterium]
MREICILAVILLAGCQGDPVPVEQAPPVIEPVEVIIEEVEVLTEPVVPEPPKPLFVMANIINLAPGTLQNILGEPSLKRVEKGARVWLYKNSECVMHLYFYPDENGDFRLDYVATAAADQTADNPTVSANACLDSHVIVTEDPQPSYPGTNTDLQPDRSGS